MTNKYKLATCPTCKHGGEFEFLGEQHWPAEIARKFELPSLIIMWSCPHCQTTISEPDLLPYQTEKPDSRNHSNNSPSGVTKPLSSARLTVRERRIMSER